MRADARTLVLLTAGWLSAGCVTLQHAPKSVQEEKLLVRVWVGACPAQVDCLLSRDRRRYQGALLALERDTLTLLAWQKPDPIVALPIDSVAQIRLYRGRRPSVKSAVRQGLLGAAVGAVGGATWGAIAGAPFGEAGELAAWGAAGGAATGLVGGVYVGIFEGDEHWEAVSLASLRTLYCLTNEKANCRPERDLVADAAAL